MENTSDYSIFLIFLVNLPCAIFMLVLMTGPLVFLAQSRKVKIGQISSTYNLTIASHLLPPKVFTVILKCAEDNKYKVEDIETDTFRVILSKPVSFSNFGFFYPISINQSLQDGQSIIEIGIQSRLIERSVIIRRHHQRLINLISTALNAYDSKKTM